MTRVLSTSAAAEAVTRMQAILTGGFVEQINQLGSQGQILSSPEVWDGAAAAQFRTTWEANHRVLQQMREQMEGLRVQVAQINANIMTAGGNG